MILMYHKVDIIAPTLWWVTPDDLQRQLACLRDRTFVYLNEYTSPETQVVLTFDDAYENVHHHAIPILDRHKVPFEIFVIGDRIGRWNDFDRGEPLTRHMNLDQLRDVAGCGGRLQWHTRSHAHLPDLTPASLEHEMTVPGALGQEFGPPHFKWFSYPGGSFNEDTLQVARRLFTGAVSVFQGSPSNRWCLNRVTVDRDIALPAGSL